jgi:hypothetical protein
MLKSLHAAQNTFEHYCDWLKIISRIIFIVVSIYTRMGSGLYCIIGGVCRGRLQMALDLICVIIGSGTLVIGRTIFRDLVSLQKFI